MRRISPPRRSLGIALGAAFLLIASPCAGQMQAEIAPATLSGPQQATWTVSVVADLRTGGETLGSYGATLSWDPAVVDYVGDSGGGGAPFDSAVVNRTDVGLGFLAFGDADPIGSVGPVTLLQITLRAVGEPLDSTVLDLELSSAFEAGTFDDLVPASVVRDGLATVTGHDLDLRPVDGAGTIWEWNAVAGATAYDLFRGDLGGLFDDGAAVQLGAVLCVEDDSLDTTTGSGTEPSNPDTALPAIGAAFFYLVRFEDGLVAHPLGFSHPAIHERTPGSGSCLP